MRLERPLVRALVVTALALAACDRSTPTSGSPPPVATAPEPDDSHIAIALTATAEDNGPDPTSVTCARTTLCSGLELAPHRPTTTFTVSGPGGATITIGGASVTLPAGAEPKAKLDVPIDYGALPLTKLFAPMEDAPQLDLRVKVKRKSGAEEEQTVKLTVGASTLHQVLRATGRRPTTFAGEPAEPHKPPIIYSQPGQKFYGEPKLVRDVDIIALWEPKERRKAKDCGPYTTFHTDPGTYVERYLQDYHVTIVDRRSGKVLEERYLKSEEGPCPSSFLGKKGEPLVSPAGDYEVDKLLTALRK